MKDEFEKYAFYRFIKAFYYTLLIIFNLIIFGIGYSNIPEEFIDNDNSYFTCSDKGPSYSFSEVGIFIYSKDEIFDKNSTNASNPFADLIPSQKQNEKKAREKCYSNPFPQGSFTAASFSSPEKAAHYYGYSYNPAGDYTFTVRTKINGSCMDVLYWWLFGWLIIYTFLNIIKELIIYIVYGRKFTWDWIIKPIRYLNSL